MKRWTEKDIAILKEELELGTRVKDIASILNRTILSIRSKVYTLGLKSKSNKWTKEDIEVLKEELELGTMHKDIGFILGRTTEATRQKAFDLKLKSKNIGSKPKSTEEYDAELKIKNPTTVRVDDYINSREKILHRCLICGTEYLCKPESKLQGFGHCGRKYNNGTTIPSNKPGITYLVYLLNEKLYKVGITSKTVKERIKDLGIKDYEIILERYFDNGDDVMALEKEWLKNVDHLKINTGLLKSGNTETFRY